jgi:hypothetical protein
MTSILTLRSLVEGTTSYVETQVSAFFGIQLTGRTVMILW